MLTLLVSVCRGGNLEAGILNTEGDDLDYDAQRQQAKHNARTAAAAEEVGLDPTIFKYDSSMNFR